MGIKIKDFETFEEIENLTQNEFEWLNLPDNIGLLQEVFKQQMDAARAGTHATLDRSEVSGSNKKMRPQKGSGRARMGDKRPPHHRKGGVVFGPDGRLYEYSMPKKKVKKAKYVCLAMKNREGNLHIMNNLNVPEIKTKAFAEKMKKFSIKDAIFIDVAENKNLYLSLRNVIKMNYLPVNAINVKSLMKNSNVIISKEAFQIFSDNYQKISKKKIVEKPIIKKSIKGVKNV